ncbi:MAG: hypothetical protein JSS86_17930 [Cyanobacteria bacterium SZAS LIN-2]|nr:hypothetical protein [Cyanobacteria bacterium SZAS LIN-3]MBS1998211.1 hypothetical protein [Cyanobacteria bacterium SZAS LIN-2]MBS2005878.1 hypothetical protein [Cyanobacteria bacterium SZAS TMP-1]
MRLRRKARGGSQIAELAPALLILFIVVLFPMLDVMYIGLGYCCGWYLNHMTSRACATVQPTATDYAAACTAMNAQWSASSLSGFTGANIVSNTAVPQPSAVNDPVTGKPTISVLVTTRVRVNPFFTLGSMPLINNLAIDGLTRPITFMYSDRRPAEEQGLN